MALSYSGRGAACLCSAFDSDITCRLTRGPVVTRKVRFPATSSRWPPSEGELPEIPVYQEPPILCSSASKLGLSKEDVLALERTGEIGFGHHAGRHLPVERAWQPGSRSTCVRGCPSPSLCVSVSGSAGETVLLVKGVIQSAGGVMRHVAPSIIKIPASQPVVGRCCLEAIISRILTMMN